MASPGAAVEIPLDPTAEVPVDLGFGLHEWLIALGDFLRSRRARSASYSMRTSLGRASPRWNVTK
jgi:hypothetical protein